MNTIIELAIETATKAHQGQNRKGTDVPYITHPFSVGMILSEAGCTTEEIAAGILHDTVEDTDLTLEDIKFKFGEKIALIVEGCSEPDKSQTWEKRKSHSIDYLKDAPPEVKIVALADKLQNISKIAADYLKSGEGLWDRFKRGKAKQKWYYENLVDSLRDKRYTKKQQGLYIEFIRVVKSVF